MSRDDQLIAVTWHQRSSSIEARERLLDTLTPGPGRVLLATCHRVELYAVASPSEAPSDVARRQGVTPADVSTATVRVGPFALAHLFCVAAGLDSSIAGEPQILAQVRRAYTSSRELHPLLVAAFGRALHVARAVRTSTGLSSARSVGSLAVDHVIEHLAEPSRSTTLVIGAGEMGKLAVRALANRVRRVIVANRDAERAVALAVAHDATAIALDAVPAVLGGVDAVVSAADTRGAILTTALLAPRLRDGGPLFVMDIAVPRSLDAAARELLGDSYRSIDDLPGAAARVDAETLAAAGAQCEAAALRFMDEREPERVEAIRALRAFAEDVRSAKLHRALRHLRHLSERDRRIVEMLAARITNGLLHEPIAALREQRADPRAARALFERTP